MVKGTLYFHSAKGEHRIVKEHLSEDKIGEAITAYVKELNPNFHIYYTRAWETASHSIMYDIGSHSEFFEYVKEGK